MRKLARDCEARKKEGKVLCLPALELNCTKVCLFPRLYLPYRAMFVLQTAELCGGDHMLLLISIQVVTLGLAVQFPELFNLSPYKKGHE